MAKPVLLFSVQGDFKCFHAGGRSTAHRGKLTRESVKLAALALARDCPDIAPQIMAESSGMLDAFGFGQ